MELLLGGNCAAIKVEQRTLFRRQETPGLANGDGFIRGEGGGGSCGCRLSVMFTLFSPECSRPS